MRTIKFKAYDEENQFWISNWWYYLHEDVLKPKADKYVHLIQFTGFKDAYGKEIYEADVIANLDSTRLQVIFYKGRWALYNNVEKYYEDLYFELKRVPLRVIGNKYENSELLDN